MSDLAMGDWRVYPVLLALVLVAVLIDRHLGWPLGALIGLSLATGWHLGRSSK